LRLAARGRTSWIRRFVGSPRKAMAEQIKINSAYAERDPD
jgi:hypothetical protein